MIDTFKIIHQGNYLEYAGPARQFEHVCTQTGEINSWTGNCRNLFIKGNSFRLIVSGSMPMFLRGTNYSELTDTDDVSAGIEEIGSYLSMPVLDWALTRFDFPINIELSHRVKDYLLLYADHPTMKSATNFLRQGSQIVYRDSTGSISIYDKIAECKNKNIPFPQCMTNANIARIERSFERSYLQSGRISTTKTLLNSSFYFDAAKRFSADFFAVRRKQSLTIPTDKLPTNSRGMNTMLQAAGVEHLGYEQVQSLILRGKELEDSTPNSRYRMRQQLRLHADNPPFHFGDELTEEFDSKIRDRFKDLGVRV
jgi:hypothetical protein